MCHFLLAETLHVYLPFGHPQPWEVGRAGSVSQVRKSSPHEASVLTQSLVARRGQS